MFIKSHCVLIHEWQNSTCKIESDVSVDCVLVQYRIRGERGMSRGERRRLEQLEDEVELCLRREHFLTRSQSGWYRKCSRLLRPIEVVFGLFFFCLAALIFVSLLLTKCVRTLPSLCLTTECMCTSLSFIP